MKKLIFLAVAALFATSLSAQNVGIRMGGNFEASYKYKLSEGSFAEGNLGLNGWYRGLQLTATYNKYLLETDVAGLHLNIYAGAGLGVAYRWNDNHNTDLGKITGYTEMSGKAHKSVSGFLFGVVGQAGAEYQVPGQPMTIALEYRPMIGMVKGRYAGKGYADDGSWKQSRFYTPGLLDLGVVVRYKF